MIPDEVKKNKNIYFGTGYIPRAVAPPGTTLTKAEAKKILRRLMDRYKSQKS